MTYSVLQGDVRDVLTTLEGESFDAMLTDPPYHLTTGKRGGTGEASVNLSHPAGRARISTGFMGQRWDGGDIAFRPEMWREAMRVLKPGAFALIFGGTRTWHRLAVALEDAGFEIRDTLMWLYGEGFPKSHDVSKAIDKAAGVEREVVGESPYVANRQVTRAWEGGEFAEGRRAITAPATPEAERWQGYGTALKPAYEPILLVRKPTPLTYAQNALEHGTGALNIDGTRVPIEDGDAAQGGAKSANNRGEAVNYAGGGYDGEVRVNTEGRWPANLIHDGSDEVTDLFPYTKGKVGMTKHGAGTNSVYGTFKRSDKSFTQDGVEDEGSAARFFYTAKASTNERDAGLEGRNPHPTVKPLALTEYLARLLLPPPRDTPRRILVPFAGSGSEVIGALKAGWDEAVGIEREPEYAALAETRLAHWTKGIQLGLAFLEAV